MRVESFKGSRSTQAGRAARGGGRGRCEAGRCAAGMMGHPWRGVLEACPSGPRWARRVAVKEEGAPDGPPTPGSKSRPGPCRAPRGRAENVEMRRGRAHSARGPPACLSPASNTYTGLRRASTNPHGQTRLQNRSKTARFCGKKSSEPVTFGVTKWGTKHLYLCFFDVGSRARRGSRTAGPGGPPLPRLCSSPPHRLRP